MRGAPQKKSPARAFLWFLIIPVQLVIDVALVALGPYIDSQIFSDTTAPGHAMPFFTVIMPFVALALTIIAVIVSVVMVVIRYSGIKKKNYYNQEL